MVGEQRKQIEALMQEEAEKLVDKLNSYKGKPIDPEIDLKTAVINIISALVDTYYYCAVNLIFSYNITIFHGLNQAFLYFSVLDRVLQVMMKTARLS